MRFMLVFTLLVWPLFGFGDVVVPLPVEVSPTDPFVNYVARLDWRNPQAPIFDWAGSSITLRFEGTALNARLRTSNADRLEVVVDGKPNRTLILAKEPRLYSVASGLSPGEHTVGLFKRTEPFHGAVQFFGFQLAADAKLLPVKKSARFIEFIGDSITCGYGNEAPNAQAHFSAETSNNYQAWGSVASRALGADSLAIAVTASRLTEPPEELGMPTFYQQVLLFDRASRWNFAQARKPDVVVINLGTNDFFRDDPDELWWKDSYEKLLTSLRERYSEAQLIIALGPMLQAGGKLDRWRRWNAEVVAKCRARGDAKVQFLDLGIQDPKDGFGADGHPNVRTHARMAKQLVGAIKAAIAW